jgi:hypothetical protein
MQIGSVWCVQITLPPKLDVIKTEKEAREWIARKSAEWLNRAKFYAPSSISSSPHACVATQNLPLSRRVSQSAHGHPAIDPSHRLQFRGANPDL